MDLKHNKITKEKAAENLRVMVDGIPWMVQKIAIVRRKNGDRTQWVRMIIVDYKSGLQIDYLMERLSMIKAWMALDFGAITKEHITNLITYIDGKKCTVKDVSAFEKKGEGWIQIIVAIAEGSDQIITIERQGMIDAYYALRTNIEDLLDDGVDVIGDLLDL